MKNLSEVLHKLLETYIVGMRELGAQQRRQNLVVVFTMADAIGEFMGSALGIGPRTLDHRRAQVMKQTRVITAIWPHYRSSYIDLSSVTCGRVVFSN